jgi:hypothetical protein
VFRASTDSITDATDAEVFMGPGQEYIVIFYFVRKSNLTPVLRLAKKLKNLKCKFPFMPQYTHRCCCTVRISNKVLFWSNYFRNMNNSGQDQMWVNGKLKQSKNKLPIIQHVLGSYKSSSHTTRRSLYLYKPEKEKSIHWT